FISQPVELLEGILDHIAEPQDLLSVALTTRAFYELIVPHHIEFRHIRSNIYRKGLWEWLAE
ncbi:hypothetical protein M422DRAFT_101688, partial [Sphaerobolus stellatus SS14]